MRICLSAKPEQNIGGGFTFTRNIVNYLTKLGIQCVYDPDGDFDIYFIIGPTTADKDKVRELKKKGIPVVLRIDNIPEDYRNRGTALSRLKLFSELADVIVYQSEWAKRYVMGYTGKDGTVIYNGIDTEIFKKAEPLYDNMYLYVRSSTNESKRWQEAKYIFREAWLLEPSACLTIVGNFADYIKLYGDDFVDRYRLGLFDEPFVYLGQIEDPKKMAGIYQSHKYLIAPFFNDACSNAILEARACGCEIILGTAENSGSNPEVMALPLDRIGIDYMAEQYLGIFCLVKGLNIYDFIKK